MQIANHLVANGAPRPAGAEGVSDRLGGLARLISYIRRESRCTICVHPPHARGLLAAGGDDERPEHREEGQQLSAPASHPPAFVSHTALRTTLRTIREFLNPHTPGHRADMECFNEQKLRVDDLKTGKPLYNSADEFRDRW